MCRGQGQKRNVSGIVTVYIQMAIDVKAIGI